MFVTAKRCAAHRRAVIFIASYVGHLIRESHRNVCAGSRQPIIRPSVRPETPLRPRVVTRAATTKINAMSGASALLSAAKQMAFIITK